MKLTSNVNLVFQIAAFILQLLNLALPILPEDKKAYAMAIIGVIQAIISLKAQFVNPDGTPAEAPYNKLNNVKTNGNSKVEVTVEDAKVTTTITDAVTVPDVKTETKEEVKVDTKEEDKTEDE